MIAVIITILAVASQSFLAVQGGPIVGDLKALCEGQAIDGALTMDRVSSMAAKIDAVRGDIACPDHIKFAISELGEVTSGARANACTKDSVNSIRAFYLTYIEGDRNDEQLPKALETFALTYAMRMSQRCKTNMAEFLAGEASELLKREDFDSVAEIIKSGSDVDQLVSGIAEPGEVLLPSDLAATLPDKDEMLRKFGFQSKANSEMMQVKNICEKRFKPVYGPIVEPVAALSRSGFDYSDKAIASELSLNEDQTKRLNEWVRIVFICDVLDLADAFQRSGIDNQEGSVVFMADKSDGDLAESIDHDTEQENIEPKNQVRMDNIEPLSEEELNQLMRDLQSSKADRLKERLREKAASLAKMYLKNKALKAWQGCWWPKEEVAENDIGTGAVGRDQQLCGRPSSFGSMFFQIFMAGLLALVMMLLSAG